MPAKVIGADSKTDLALLKAQGSDFPFVTFAAQPPRVGDWVIAVGNPFGLGGTVTAGIVSARGRDIGSGPYDDFLQIDAPVNHGFPAARLQRPGRGRRREHRDLLAVRRQRRHRLRHHQRRRQERGAAAQGGWRRDSRLDPESSIQPVTPDIAGDLGLKSASGALVAQTTKNSPAETAGVKSGDVVTAVDGETVADPHDLARRIAALGAKKTATLAVIRNGSPMAISVTLATMPADKTAGAETGGTENGRGDTGNSALAKLGLTLRRSSDGVVVTDVDPDSAAADNGLKEGDVILEVAGKTVSRPSEVAQAIDAAKGDGKKSGSCA